MKKILFTALAATLMLNLSGCSKEEPKQAQTARPAASTTVARPDFQLPDLEGRLQDVRQWDGKVLVVNFWATWCPPCRREIPAFMALQDHYGDQGVQFVGIALDDTDKVQDYVDTHGIEYPILVGNNAAIETAKAYGNRLGSLPYTAIIDRQGRIHSTHMGELLHDDAEKIIKGLL